MDDELINDNNNDNENILFEQNGLDTIIRTKYFVAS